MFHAVMFMTTSNWQFREQDFRMLSNLPQVQAAVHTAAEKVKGLMEAAWPDEPGESKQEIFGINSYVGEDGRPVDVIMVKHPAALARQAHHGLFSKAIAISGFETGDGKRGK